jgi:GNAT superfamily N-acetyltransferase
MHSNDDAVPALDPHPREVPPGYPREYERRLRLADGRHVWIRPVVPADAPVLAAAIRTADPDTLYRRFLGGAPRITPALLAYLTRLDYTRRFALGAADEVTGQGVAIGRYETSGEGVAEVAVAVDPAWRGVGLATALVETLAQAALDRGIHTFCATFLAENQPVTALVRLVGPDVTRSIREGIAEFSIALNREKVERAVQALSRDDAGSPPPTDGPDRYGPFGLALFPEISGATEVP